ncbi:unnamed protein product, partial [Ectocarpus sp. 4 AP-2014]
FELPGASVRESPSWVAFGLPVGSALSGYWAGANGCPTQVIGIPWWGTYVSAHDGLSTIGTCPPSWVATWVLTTGRWAAHGGRPIGSPCRTAHGEKHIGSPSWGLPMVGGPRQAVHGQPMGTHGEHAHASPMLRT